MDSAHQVSKPNLHSTHYRPDIDGLRAMAVLTVMAFHAFPDSVKGGFIGVDVFFVISGFLITKLIQSGLDNQHFRFSAFYASRVRRLFPSLLVVLLSCLFLGWFALLSDEYKLLGKHISATAVLIPNWILWSDSGYFDYAAHSKPLLHLWSLGVEEQFYLCWPLTFCLLYRHRFNVLGATCILLLCSFFLNLYMIEKYPSASFFWPFTRAWELLAGSLLAQLMHSGFGVSGARKAKLADNRLLKQSISILGVLMLSVGLLVIDQEKRFPGSLALLPVIGTLLIIAAGPHSWFNQTVLSHRLLVGIGLISYPLYLWHWPLLSFATILEQNQPAWQVRSLCIAVAFLLSWLTYVCIERPARFGRHLKAKTYSLIALMLITACLGFATYASEGFKSRFANQLIEVQIADLTFDMPTSSDWYCSQVSNEGPRCLASGPAPTAVVMGDSHALTIYPGLVARFQSKGQTLALYGGSDGCPPLLNVVIQDIGGDVRNCLQKGTQAILRIIQDPAIKEVILTSRGPMYTTGQGFGDIESSQFGTWVLHFEGEERGFRSNEQVFLKGLASTLDALKAADKKITFLHDVPELGFDIRSCFSFRPMALSNQVKMPCAVAKSDFLARTEIHRAAVDQILSARPEVKVIDLAQALCEDQWCFGAKNDVLLYMDDDHLSRRGAEYVVRQLWDQF
jgi:peptidoglycan/LPS O-acetylase OafA/YrhL